jgi:hypothetical protein
MNAMFVLEDKEGIVRRFETKLKYYLWNKC